MSYSKHLTQTNQTSAIPGKKTTKNNAGGYTFELDNWNRLNRFLILGSESPTYYVDEQKLTVDNAQTIINCVRENGTKAVSIIRDTSVHGNAPKNDPAIFALALAATYGDAETKSAAYAAVPLVCRIGTHLFQFCQAVQDLRGWSSGLRKAVSSFYTNKTVDQVALQLIKYRQRDGWTHKDVLRLAHPKSTLHNELFAWTVGKHADGGNELIRAFNEAQDTNTSTKRLVQLIREYRLPREALPTAALNNIGVWDALLEEMPLTALVRNLGKMSSLGLFDSNLYSSTKHVVDIVTNPKLLKAARIHPLALLNALNTYAQGHGDKGSLTWTPNTAIKDALDAAFYMAFDNVEATGKNYFLGVDVSGSMTTGRVGGMNITPNVAAAAMAMAIVRSEKNFEIRGFTSTLKDLKISKTDDLRTVARKTQDGSFGTTDCSLPMTYALEKRIPVDTFVVLTDNETYAGRVHPSQALLRYRQQMGIDAKLVVVGMTATEFTIADPSDKGMLDVVGFDTAVPKIIADFSTDKI